MSGKVIEVAETGNEFDRQDEFNALIAQATAILREGKATACIICTTQASTKSDSFNTVAMNHSDGRCVIGISQALFSMALSDSRIMEAVTDGSLKASTESIKTTQH